MQYTCFHSSILLFTCVGGSNFTCPEGKVLPSAKVCDAIPDCKNAEDEYDCLDDYQATSEEQDLSLNEEDLSLLDNYDEEDLDKFVEEYYDTDKDLDGIPDDVDLVDNRDGVVESGAGNGTDWFDAK